MDSHSCTRANLNNTFLPNSVLEPRVPYKIIVLVAKDKVKLQCLLIPHSVGHLVMLEFSPLTSCADIIEGNGYHVSWKLYESWRSC